MFKDNSGKNYRTYSQYLKDKFGEKVYKVTLNANLGCPNRDGTKSFGGCIFCDDVGSFSQAHDANLSIKNLQNIINPENQENLNKPSTSLTTARISRMLNDNQITTLERLKLINEEESISNLVQNKTLFQFDYPMSKTKFNEYTK